MGITIPVALLVMYPGLLALLLLLAANGVGLVVFDNRLLPSRRALPAPLVSAAGIIIQIAFFAGIFAAGWTPWQAVMVLLGACAFLTTRILMRKPQQTPQWNPPWRQQR
jgi:hypothetical protein